MSDAVVEEFLEGLRTGDPRAVDAADRLLRAMASVPLTRALTEREEEVIALVIAGLTEKEIAAQIHLSRETVKQYTARIREALGARSMPQAVWLWTNAKWVRELREILSS